MRMLAAFIIALTAYRPAVAADLELVGTSLLSG